MVLRRRLTETEPLGPAEPIKVDKDDEADEMHIDARVPPKIMRLTQHLHNLIYIRFFYEQIGQQPPNWIKRQMARAEEDLLDEIDKEEGQGGHFHRRLKNEAG